jgi:phosphatidylinositol alpha-1,6-mannosyltransferase
LKQVFMGLESAAAGNGGISRVARLVARVLEGHALAGRVAVRGVILKDAAAPADLRLPLPTVRNSRARFVAAVNRAAFGHTHYFFDHPGMARAHGWLPGPRRPFATFIYGIEVWQGTAHPAHVRAALRADILLTISAYTRDRATALAPGLGRARVCWPATETDHPTMVPRRTDGPPRVLILGRIDEHSYKGHAELIRCWPAVVAAVPGAVLTIAGTGPGTARYRRMAEQTGLPAGRIDFRGFVAEDRLEDLWGETTVLAMPSRGEGFGLVYIEAMRAGVPVVASVHDAAPEVNPDGITGYNVNLDRPDELPERLIHLLRHPDHAATLGRIGRARWHEHFRFERFRDRFTPLLGEFLDESL